MRNARLAAKISLSVAYHANCTRYGVSTIYLMSSIDAQMNKTNAVVDKKITFPLLSKNLFNSPFLKICNHAAMIPINKPPYRV